MEATPEQRLFARILRLTLLRGMVIGLFAAITGMWVYNFIQRFFFLEPVPFFFEGPFGALPTISVRCYDRSPGGGDAFALTVSRTSPEEQ